MKIPTRNSSPKHTKSPIQLNIKNITTEDTNGPNTEMGVS